jgi:lipopolysaccharide/colanic/teichoic acid biosynthesis glycosyltransferase
VRQRGLALALKRAIDVTVAGGALLVSAPTFAAAAVATRVSAGSPVFFRQRRPGLRGRPFEVAKFRTMNDARDADGKLLPDEQRLTRVGAFLRTTSVDELPQLWNVLRGEMSLVGPRPLLMQYLPRYSHEQARRHDVLPGITGWAQINGRNTLAWSEKFALDVWYVDHWTPWLDVVIIAKTIKRVIMREGITSDGHATMPEFMGNVL